MVGMQNLFVDVSIKISISRATRLFYFLGNSCPVFLPLSRGVTVSWAEEPARLMSKGESFSSFQTCRLVSFFLTIRVTCNSFGVRPMKMCELDSPSSPAARPPPPQPTRCARPPSFHPGLSQPILLLIVLVFAACPPQIQP